MNRSWARAGFVRRFAVVAAVVAAFPVVAAQPGAAATPGAGTLSFAHPLLTWTGSGLTGVAPKSRKTTCNGGAPACDNFAFVIDDRNDGALDPYSTITLTLTPSTTGQMSILLYPPGCDLSTGPNCYADLGAGPAILTAPDPGTYTLQVACTACANASYTMNAALTRVLPDLPRPGTTSRSFQLQTLPTIDSKLAVASTGRGQLTSTYGEPAIWINKAGYGVVNTFGPILWITRDAGKTWSQPYDLLGKDTVCPDGYAGDADAVVGPPPDNIFYADNLCLGTVGGVNNEMFVNATGGVPGDSGNNWKGPFLAGGNSDRQWIAPDPVDPNIVYFSYHDISNAQDVELYKSTDKGQTWTCPATGAPAESAPCPAVITAGGGPAQTAPDTLSGNVTTRAMIDPTDHNTIFLPYADAPAVHGFSALPTRGDSELTRFRMAVSHDGGKTWNANSDPTGQGVVVDANDGTNWPAPAVGAEDNVLAHIFISAAMDTRGGLYALFSLRLSGQTETHLYLVTSTDHGQTWSTPHQVDSGDLNSNVFPAIAVGDPGRVAMAWYGAKTHDFNDTKGQWSMMEATSTDALSATPHFDQTRMSSGKAAVHNADVCQAGTLCAVTGGNRNLSDYQTGAVDPCGMPLFVYTDDHTGTGTTVVARQTAGPRLYSVDPCAPVGPMGTTQPNTGGTGAGSVNPSTAGAAIGTPNTSAAASHPVGPFLGAGLIVLGVALRRRRRAKR